MGKGDQKSKQGKIANGSYGVTRKRKKSTTKHQKTNAVVQSTPKSDEEKIKKPVAKKTPSKGSANKPETSAKSKEKAVEETTEN